MAEYRLGDQLLATTTARDELAKLRKRYADLGAELSGSFGQRFATFGSADDLFAHYPNEIETAFSRTVSLAAKDVAAQKIYHWDDSALRKQLEERAEQALEKFEQIRDQYIAIIMTAEERENLRAEAGQSRPSIIGGGFGVEGAVKGMAAATAANAAIGLVHGTANAVSKAIATGGDKRKKKELLQAPTTKSGLSDVLRDIAVEGHRLVADLVNGESQETKFDVVTDVAARRAVALIANVAAGRVPDDETAAVLVEALQLDPFLEEGWRLWVELIGDQDGSVARAAYALGFGGLVHHKRSLLERRRAELLWSTPEECRSSCDTLEAVARFYGVPFDTIRHEIETLAAALDERRRTFRGTVYAAVEEMEAAQAEAAAMARRTVAGVVLESEAAADQARDLKARTFNGRVYGSQEDAQMARGRQIRSSSFFYWVAIVLAPFPSAFITTRRGFSKTQRYPAFFWMVICAAFVIYKQDVLGVIALAIAGTFVFLVALVLGEAEFRIRRWFSRDTSETHKAPNWTVTDLADLQIGGKRVF